MILWCFQFRRQIQSVAVGGEYIMAAARDTCQKSLARLEAKDAAAKAAAIREKERVAELKRIRGERWLPSIAKKMQVKLKGWNMFPPDLLLLCCCFSGRHPIVFFFFLTTNPIVLIFWWTSFHFVISYPLLASFFLGQAIVKYLISEIIFPWWVEFQTLGWYLDENFEKFSMWHHNWWQFYDMN